MIALVEDAPGIFGRMSTFGFDMTRKIVPSRRDAWRVPAAYALRRFKNLVASKEGTANASETVVMLG